MRTRLLALSIIAACAKDPPAEIVPPAALGAGPETTGAAAVALAGPFGSLDEAPSPHGAERIELIDAGPDGGFEEVLLVEYKDPTGATPPRCAVAMRLGAGWYVSSGFACERSTDTSAMNIEALAIDLEATDARVWYKERVRYDDPNARGDEREEERTMVIECRLAEGQPPACAEAVPRATMRE